MKHPVWILYAASLMLTLSVCELSWAKKPQKVRVATSSGTQSAQQAYNGLLEQQIQIGTKISNLSLQLHSAPKAKAKKINHQINLLSDELVAVERKLSAFPARFTGVENSNLEQSRASDDSFRQQMDSIATNRVAASNPFAGQLSADPELDRMYRAYLKANGNGVALAEQIPIDTKGVVYRVMVAISKTRLPLTQFAGMDDVAEQVMPDGGYVYYAGKYSSLNQAQRACDQILARHKFRDAFVVAMQGTRRVPIRK